MKEEESDKQEVKKKEEEEAQESENEKRQKKVREGGEEKEDKEDKEVEKRELLEEGVKANEQVSRGECGAAAQPAVSREVIISDAGSSW